MGIILKQKYRDFCKNESSIPIFSRDWWLDAVCSEPGVDWNVILLHKGDNIIASMPYCIKRRHGLTYITMPKLTQALGPWLRDSQAKYAKALAHQKALMTDLIQGLPPFDHFVQNFHYPISNWLPFYWQGFSQTTRYTYILEDISNLDRVWGGFESKIRTDIRKAEKTLTVDSNADIDSFLYLNDMTFARQGFKTPYSRALIKQLDISCQNNGCRKVFIASDSQNRMHAGVYLVWDHHSAYYLMSGANPELRNSGATSLCLWEAIRFASQVCSRFDFEGSMIEPVERFFRGFGARQVPYFQINKMSRLMQMIVAVRNLIKPNKI
jgi:hypothetical protein